MTTCKLHSIQISVLCPVCEHRDSYMVRGNVRLFDEGYADGLNKRPNRAEQYARSQRYQDAADYADGYKQGAAYADRRVA